MSLEPVPVPEIFDRNARRLRRQRATGRGFLVETMTTDLLDRLDGVQRKFSRALIIGDNPLLKEGLRSRGIDYALYLGDEDRLTDRSAAHGLILSSGTLDTVADLPGALILMRRALQVDGLLLANCAAAPSLTALRSAIATANADCGHDAARIHPQIDVRSAGDLLVRAGFALPVADVDTLNISYSGLAPLIADLREASATNVLARRYPVSRRWLSAATAAFQTLADAQGRTHETLSFITLTGWAPAPSQPQPARRGSATASLAEALRRRSD
jgi:NADH dehydrogenase [ubiquinone] 1 alpha subcomplex assembly factor 5